MKRIIFTGGSSFTGYHFIKQLNQNKIKVIVFFSFSKKDIDKFNKNKIKRINYIIKHNTCFFECIYGSKNFINTLAKFNQIDIFCHHFAYTKDYNNNNFKFAKSIKVNTLNIDKVLNFLKQKKLKKLIYSGSYFEPNYSRKLNELISPYGLSKFLTGKIIEILCKKNSINFSKFIISNPFGELEDENRLATLIASSWGKNKIFNMKSPYYIRDYIPVSILRKLYFNFLFDANTRDFDPSYYVISNIKFIEIFSKKMETKSINNCLFEFDKNMIFKEPRIINNTNKSHKYYSFKKKLFTNEEIKYYKSIITN